MPTMDCSQDLVVERLSISSSSLGHLKDNMLRETKVKDPENKISVFMRSMHSH